MTGEKIGTSVLIITPYPLIPRNTGGRIRIHELAAGLAEKGVNVTVLMPMSPSLWRRRKVAEHLVYDVLPYPFLIPFLLSGRPFPFLHLVSFHHGLRFLTQRHFRRHNIIQFEGVSFASLTGFVPAGKKIIYDAHNVEYDDIQAECRQSWVRTITARRTFRLEQKMVAEAEAVLCCSQSDMTRMQSLYDMPVEKAVLLPNGIHLNRSAGTPGLPAGALSRLMQYPGRAIFSGSDVLHNREAVSFIVRTLAPQLKESWAFVIMGPCGTSFKSEAGENVFLDLHSGDVGPYADICTAALNPVEQGSGTSMKVLDYLAHGLAVVSTPFGMRGFDNLRPHVSVAERHDFADVLLAGKPFRPEASAALEFYSWKSIAKRLHHELFGR